MQPGSTIHSLIQKLYDYWRHEVEQTQGLRDPDVELPPSCATSFQVAALCVAAHKHLKAEGALDLARSITVDAAERQYADGSFGQPYYVAKGEPQTRDIAEIGASGRALYYLAAAGIREAEPVLRRAASYLVSQTHPTKKGVIYKRPDATHHDVLNGDAYAGDTFYWTHVLTQDPAYKQRAADVVAHLAERFGRSSPGWWPYAEDWDGQPTAGNNVAYQGTVIAFTAPWFEKVSNEALRSKYEGVLREATRTVLDQIALAPSQRDEDKNVWWAIQDRISWETVLALWHVRDLLPEAGKIVDDHLATLLREWKIHGPSVFDPPGETRPDPSRTAVTSRFRRLATASGILSYMALE